MYSKPVFKIAGQVVDLVEQGIRRAPNDGPLRVLLVGTHQRAGSPTMVARRIHKLASARPLSEKESATVARLREVAGLPPSADTRPFRAPHHSCSDEAIVGAKYDHNTGVRRAFRHVGEASLAHHGVLYLEQVMEFRLATLATLDTAVSHGKCGVWPSRPRFLLFGAPACACDSYKGRRCNCEGDGPVGREAARWRQRSTYRISAMLRPDVTVNTAELSNAECLELTQLLDKVVTNTKPRKVS